MQKYILFIVISLITIFISCESPKKEHITNTPAKPQYKPNEILLGETKKVSYKYLGQDAGKITRNVSVVVSPSKETSANPDLRTINLKIKNAGFDPFFVSGNEIFLLSDGEIIGDLEQSFGDSQLRVLVAEEKSYTINLPNFGGKSPDRLEIRKRTNEGLELAFAIIL